MCTRRKWRESRPRGWLYSATGSKRRRVRILPSRVSKTESEGPAGHVEIKPSDVKLSRLRSFFLRSFSSSPRVTHPPPGCAPFGKFRCHKIFFPLRVVKNLMRSPSERLCLGSNTSPLRNLSRSYLHIHT